jgi:hypothetical protein
LRGPISPSSLIYARNPFGSLKAWVSDPFSVSIIKDIEKFLFRRVIALMMSVDVIMNTEVFHLVEVAIEV